MDTHKGKYELPPRYTHAKEVSSMNNWHLAISTRYIQTSPIPNRPSHQHPIIHTTPKNSYRPCIAWTQASAPLLESKVTHTLPKYPRISGVATRTTVPNLTHSISISACDFQNVPWYTQKHIYNHGIHDGILLGEGYTTAIKIFT